MRDSGGVATVAVIRLRSRSLTSKEKIDQSPSKASLAPPSACVALSRTRRVIAEFTNGQRIQQLATVRIEVTLQKGYRREWLRK